jgi:type VI secretion system protein ImpM
LPSEPLIPGGAFVFGKLPTHGDFVARGLSASTRDAWDGWLSAALERDRLRLGDAFEAAHDTAAPWRFVEGPGERGSGWRAGALAPSIDSVGRRFFILVGRDGLSEAAARDRGEALAEIMAELVYEAFAQAWTADDLARAASGVDCEAEPARVSRSRGRWWCAPSEDADLMVIDGTPEVLIGVLPASSVLETAI